MSKKLFIGLLIPAVLIIAGFLFVQFYMRRSIQQETKDSSYALAKNDASAAKADTLGGKKVSEADLRPLFIERMQQLLKKSSNGLYDLSVGDMKVDVLASTIALHNVTVRPDNKILQGLKSSGLLPESVFDIAFRSLVIEGVNLDEAITSKTMDYKLIKLVHPVIRITQQKAKKEKKEEAFSQRFLKEMQKLAIDRLVVEGGSIVVQDGQTGATKKLENMQVLMRNILLDSTTRTDKDRFLFAKEARLDFKDFNTQTKDGLYNFKIGTISVDAPQKKLTLKNLSYGAAVSKEAFQKKNKVAKEMYNLQLPSLTVSGVDWWQALNGREVLAKQVQMRGGKFAVYLDRDMPPTNKTGNFPNQMLMKLPLKVNVDNLSIQDLDISYEEYNPLSKQTGTIYLDNAAIDIRNIVNGSGKKAPMVIKGSALFMHQVPITANFSFDMNNYQNGPFTAQLKTEKSFDGSLLNSFAMPLGKVKVERGSVQKMDVSIKGNETQAGGDMLLLYKDLKLAMLEKEPDKKALDKKGVTSAFANLFVLKNDNPKGNKEPRKEPAQFQRDPTGGFMHLVWKSTLTGILKTIGAPEKIAYKKGK